MTPKEAGFILLTSHLGDPTRPVLTPHMMLSVHRAVSQARKDHPEANLSTGELLRMGVDPDLAQRITYLMSQRQQMEDYVRAGLDQGLVPLTPASADYPALLLKRRGFEAPGCLWAKGNIDYLRNPAISSVGSRDLREAGRDFSRDVGEQCGRQGFTVASGHAIGSDSTVELCCVEEGGKAISVLPGRLDRQPGDRDYLYLTEFDYDMDFSATRALSRNHTIHCLGIVTLVTQCTEGKGGTWSGAYANLKNKWTPVGCDNRGGPGNQALHRLGAQLVDYKELYNLPKLCDRLFASF